MFSRFSFVAVWMLASWIPDAWAQTPKENGEKAVRITFSAVGDIVFGRAGERFGLEDPFRHVAHLWKGRDIVYGNLETPITEKQYRNIKKPKNCLQVACTDEEKAYRRIHRLTFFGRPEGGSAGRVTVDGVPLEPRTPRTALRRGVALLTNDRKASGLVLPMLCSTDIGLATVPACCRGGLLSRRRERARAAPLFERLRVRGPGLDAPVTALSGGNQQKVLLARWLLTEPRVLLLDEPTRGIDVGAKADIYALLRALTAAGLGILLITSELPELLALADRVLVMHRGRIVTELHGPDATPQRVVQAAMGG